LVECPKCGSKNINEIISKGDYTNEGMNQGIKEFDLYPIRPCVEFECDDCKFRWENPIYVEYLLKRNIKEAKINDR